MKKVLTLCLLTFALAVGGCATPDHSDRDTRVAASYTDDKAMDDPNRLICTREKPIGSNRVVKTCRTKAEIDAMREATQDAEHRRRTTTPTPISDG